MGIQYSTLKWYLNIVRHFSDFCEEWKYERKKIIQNIICLPLFISGAFVIENCTNYQVNLKAKENHKSRYVRKPTFGHERHEKIQNSLRIRTVWSKSRLDTFRIAKEAKFFMRTTQFQLHTMYNCSAHVGIQIYQWMKTEKKSCIN